MLSPAGLRPESVRPKTLAELAARLGLPAPVLPGTAAGGPARRLTGITHDSRSVRPGDLYAALPGARVHGAAFAGQAAAAGALAVLTDRAGEGTAQAAGLPVLAVEDPRARLGALAAWMYDEPARQLRLIGITGTNGKTTTAYLAEGALRAAGRRTGLVGTIETRIGEERVPSARTTPEATDLQALLAVMRERGVDTVVMEVSSHALALGRVDGTGFDVAAFTNLSQDHLDFHADLEDYFATKATLFTPERARTAVVAVDDRWGQRLAATVARTLRTVRVSITGCEAEWSAGPARADGSGGTAFPLRGPAGLELAVRLRLPGAFNMSNALVAVAAVAEAGCDVRAAVRGLAEVVVPGRMERVDAGQPFAVVVDYAHTAEAVATALGALRAITPGRVLLVLGSGGDRDPYKRPDMGAAGARGADLLVVTDDNPRSEDPAAIRAAVLSGAVAVPLGQRGEVVEVGDRREALREVLRRARPGDTVLVVGKGHEQGQEVAGVVHPFDDRQVLAEEIAGPLLPSGSPAAGSARSGQAGRSG